MSFGALMLGAGIALLLALLYGVKVLFEIFEIWRKGAEPSRERRWVTASMVALGGFIAGVMAYPSCVIGWNCHSAGQPVVQCMMGFDAEKPST